MAAKPLSYGLADWFDRFTLADVTSDVNKYPYSLILSHLLVCPSLFTLVFVRAKNLLWWKMWMLQRLWLLCWWSCTLKAKMVEWQTLPFHHLSFSFANHKIQAVLLLYSVFHGFSNATSPVCRFESSILSPVEIRFLSKMFSTLGWEFKNQPS